MMSSLLCVTRSAPARTTKRDERGATALRAFWVRRGPEIDRTDDIFLRTLVVAWENCFLRV